MAEHRETTRYATPWLTPLRGGWVVHVRVGEPIVGFVDQTSAGWVANTPTGRYAGLWPTKQAAAEVLVRQAGYELGEVTQ